MTGLTGVILVTARICLVAMFPLSAIDKVWHWNDAMAQTRTAGMPTPSLLLGAAILVETATPIGIISGCLEPLSAIVLAGFCFVTAVLYHPFWRFRDFLSPSAASVSREHFWQFMKNFGLIGGILLVILCDVPVKNGDNVMVWLISSR